MPIGGGHWIDLEGQSEWVAVSLGEDYETDSGAHTCVDTTEAWATADSQQCGVEISTGLEVRPDQPGQRTADYLVCPSDPTSLVVSVEPAGESQVEVDGHPAELTEWTAMCDSGETFGIAELWIPDAGVFLTDYVGVSVLAELANDSLALTGDAPSVHTTLVGVTEIAGSQLTGEVHEWVADGHALIPPGTGEIISVSLEGAACLSGGEPAGLHEQLDTCDALRAEITIDMDYHEQESGTRTSVIRVVRDDAGTVLTAGIQFQA